MWLVCAHSMLTVSPAVGLRMSISSHVPSVRKKTNRQPLAELESANTQWRETVVLKKVILALWTSLVTGTEGKRGINTVEISTESKLLTLRDTALIDCPTYCHRSWCFFTHVGCARLYIHCVVAILPQFWEGGGEGGGEGGRRVRSCGCEVPCQARYGDVIVGYGGELWIACNSRLRRRVENRFIIQCKFDVKYF